MKHKQCWYRNRCASVSAILLGLGIQCLANAGFAVNEQQQSAEAVYSANASDVVPQFLTQKKAIALAEKHKDIKIIIAYNIDQNKSKHLSELSPNLYYFYNPYSQKISAALTREDATDLAQVHRQEFFAMAGETLSETIQRWVSYSDEQPYKLYWDSEYDYKIQYPFAFHGDLLSRQGPLDQLLASFANRDFALIAEKTRNHVLVVKDRTFKQKVVSF